MPSTTPAEDNKLHDLSPAARNEGPDSHKDNSKQTGKVNSSITDKEEQKKTGKENDDTGEDNEDNA